MYFFVKNFSFLIVSILLLLSLIIVGCNKHNQYTSSSYFNINEKSVTLDWFDEVISNNPIDEEYDRSLKEGNLTYNEIAIIYCDSWKEEFTLTKEHIKDFFDEATSQELIDELDKWEENIKNSYRWVIENVYENFPSKYGTQAFYEEYVNMASQYRYKTLWIKRIFYIEETEFNQNDVKGALLSIVWYYKIQNSDS